jgi:hypothetical protein
MSVHLGLLANRPIVLADAGLVASGAIEANNTVVGRSLNDTLVNILR